MILLVALKKKGRFRIHYLKCRKEEVKKTNSRKNEWLLINLHHSIVLVDGDHLIKNKLFVIKNITKISNLRLSLN